MGTVTLDDLRKEFNNGQIVAVDDVSLNVADGEFITVVGPSGCGKSTTLRMLAGLEQPTSGQITIDDQDVTNVHARKRDVAMVFQNYALYPHKTVRQNMAFGLRMSTDLSKNDRRERVRETAKMMGIEELLDDRPNELSGGQKQRVALGRAIVREPDVFLFDEPLSNLDAKLRTTMRTEIQRLQNNLDTTSIYVTHDQEEAMTMGDRIVILKDGERQQIGAPKEVYRNPINKFVGGFVGSPSMNFIDVLADVSEDTIHLRDDSKRFDYPLDAADYPSISNDDRLSFGIRPEDVYVTNTDSGIQTTVEVVEPIGSDNYLYLDLAPDFIARVDSDVEPEPDDTIAISFDETNIHLFSDETGESITFEDQSETETTPLP